MANGEPITQFASRARVPRIFEHCGAAQERGPHRHKPRDRRKHTYAKRAAWHGALPAENRDNGSQTGRAARAYLDIAARAPARAAWSQTARPEQDARVRRVMARGGSQTTRTLQRRGGIEVTPRATGKTSVGRRRTAGQQSVADGTSRELCASWAHNAKHLWTSRCTPTPRAASSQSATPERTKSAAWHGAR